MKKAPYAVILFFALLCLLGVAVGEVPEVLQKATKVCLQCMGIG